MFFYFLPGVCECSIIILLTYTNTNPFIRVCVIQKPAVTMPNLKTEHQSIPLRATDTIHANVKLGMYVQLIWFVFLVSVTTTDYVADYVINNLCLGVFASNSALHVNT